MQARPVAVAALALALTACGGSRAAAPDDEVAASAKPKASATAKPGVLDEAAAERLAKSAAPGGKDLSGYRKTTQPAAELNDPTITRAQKCLKVKPVYLARSDTTALLKGDNEIVVQANVLATVAEATAYMTSLDKRGTACLEEVARVDRTIVKVEFEATELALKGADTVLGWSNTSSNRAGRKTAFQTEGFLLQARVGQVVLLVSSSSFGSPRVSEAQVIRVAEQAVARLRAASGR